jgi:hypothetical protein
MALASRAPCQNIAETMDPGLFQRDFTTLQKCARNRVVICYPGERSFTQVIHAGISQVRPKGRSAGYKQGGERRAHTSQGWVFQRMFQDSVVSFLYSPAKLGVNIGIAGTKAFKAIHGELCGDFPRRMPAHSVGNDQQGAPVIQSIDQIPVLVILSVKPLPGNRFDLHFFRYPRCTAKIPELRASCKRIYLQVTVNSPIGEGLP